MTGDVLHGPPSVLVMGITASGKTTVAAALADRLGRPFVDADDHHPRRNVEKMAAGEPLDDRDRAPWLDVLAALLRDAHEDDDPVVLACSALKRRYREVLRAGAPLRTVLLDLDADEARRRIAGRDDHFMPSSLVESQLAALERPGDAIVVEATAPVDEILDRVLAALGATVTPQEPPMVGRVAEEGLDAQDRSRHRRERGYR